MSFKRRIEVNDKSYFELIMYVSTILLVEANLKPSHTKILIKRRNGSLQLE